MTRLAQITVVSLVAAALAACESGAPARTGGNRLLERTRIDAAVRLAADNLAAGKFDRARGALAGFAAGQSLELELTRARIDVEEGAYADALGRLDGCRQAAADSAGWCTLRGVALEGLGRWDEAVTAYEAAYARIAEAPALIAWADALASAGRPDDARTLLARERGRYPGDAAVCLLAARLATRTGDHATAADEYQAAARARPSDPHIRRRLAEALLLAGRPGDAIPLLESLVQDNQDAATKARLQFRLAEGYLAARRFADAQRAYRAVLAADSDPHAARVGLATAYLAADQPAEALSAATAVLAGRPHDTDAALIAALAQRRLNRTPAAIVLLERAAEHGPTPPRVRELLAVWRSN